jgi:hypothetical protein
MSKTPKQVQHGTPADHIARSEQELAVALARIARLEQEMAMCLRFMRLQAEREVRVLDPSYPRDGDHGARSRKPTNPASVSDPRLLYALSRYHTLVRLLELGAPAVVVADAQASVDKALAQAQVDEVALAKLYPAYRLGRVEAPDVEAS